MAEQSPKLYALLIGIDGYQPNRLYKSLKGAVRDINLVDTYLQQTVHPTRTWKLTSSNPEVTNSSGETSPNLLPTYENIVKSFQEITNLAEPGELVYIHYSGHGGRAKTIYEDLEGKGENDESIVPMDIGDQEDRYIRDVELATLLKRMTDKGLIVTVVLDSCHSGGATRGDSQARSAEEDDTMTRSPVSSGIKIAEREELVKNWLELRQGTGIDLAGLPARDYVLLAACRPDELAYEYTVEGKDRHGALTYWMINTLTSSAASGQRLTYKLLHDRLNAQIQSKFPQQMPMILGESERLVFGRDIWSTPYTVAVIRAQVDPKEPSKSKITLNAGLAQGLSKGTRFAIYPLHTTNFTDTEKQVAILEVKEVDTSSSIAKVVLEPKEGGVGIRGSIEPGAPAVMISAPVELIRRVRLLDNKQEGEKENELPSEWVSRQTEAMNAVCQALAGNGWVVKAQEDEKSDYQVAVGRGGEYEISIESPINNLRPLLMIDDADAADGVVKRLVHLAKYQAVQNLGNSGSKLADVLEVELLDADKQPFTSNQIPVIEDGEIVCLRITNRGNHPLKIAVLDIEPTWAISQLALDGIDAPFFQLEAGETRDTKLKLSLPEGQEYYEAREAYKIFAIRKGLADFRWLTLPSLDENLDSRGESPNEALKAIAEAKAAEEVRRGIEEVEVEKLNPLNDLLSMIGADLENAPTHTRASAVVLDPNDEWVTKQIQLIVKQ